MDLLDEGAACARMRQLGSRTPEETREILAGLCPGLEAHHHVSIPQEFISAAVFHN